MPKYASLSKFRANKERCRNNNIERSRSRSRSPRSPRRHDRPNSVQVKIKEGIRTKLLFDNRTCQIIEDKIDEIKEIAEKGGYKTCTVDRAPLRNKYFFGEGYIYGNQLKTKGPGQEKLYPKGECDPIPDWIFDLVVRPIEEAGFVEKGFVNSAVINDYLPGGCIVSHIDPPQIFDRPIVTASFLSSCALSFGCKFSYRPMRTTKPVLAVPLPRGCVLSMQGYAADNITHCVRPDDVTERRAVIILRHVPDHAPRLTHAELTELRQNGQLPPAKVPRKIILPSKETTKPEDTMSIKISKSTTSSLSEFNEKLLEKEYKRIKKEIEELDSKLVEQNSKVEEVILAQRRERRMRRKEKNYMNILSDSDLPPTSSPVSRSRYCHDSSPSPPPSPKLVPKKKKERIIS